MIRTLLCITLLLTSFNVQAGWFEKLGDALTDVRTFGEHGRRRDRERANQKKVLAAQKKRHMEDLKIQAKKIQEQKVATAQANILFFQDLKVQMTNFQDSLGNQGDILEDMANTILATGDNYGILIKLVKAQLKDMTKWAGGQKQSAKLHSKKLNEKIITYTSQVVNFPSNPTEKEVEELIQVALDAYEELALSINNINITIGSKIAGEQKTVEGLLAKPVAKPAAKLTQKPSPNRYYRGRGYVDRHGRKFIEH